MHENYDEYPEHMTDEEYAATIEERQRFALERFKYYAEKSVKEKEKTKHWIESAVIDSDEILRILTWNDINLFDAGTAIKEHFKGTEYEILAISIFNTCKELNRAWVAESKRNYFKRLMKRQNAQKAANQRHKPLRNKKEKAKDDFEEYKKIDRKRGCKKRFAKKYMKENPDLGIEYETLYKEWLTDKGGD